MIIVKVKDVKVEVEVKPDPNEEFGQHIINVIRVHQEEAAKWLRTEIKRILTNHVNRYEAKELYKQREETIETGTGG